MKLKKIVALFFVLEIFFLNFTPKAFTKKNSSISLSDGIYTIESALDSNKVLDIEYALEDNFAKLQIYEKNDTDAQKFYVHKLNDGSYELQPLCSNKFLTVQNNNYGERVFQKSSENTEFQKWKITSSGNEYFYICSSSNNLAMSIYNSWSGNQTPVYLYNKNKSNSQKFKFNPIKIFDTENYTVSADKSKLQIDKLKNLLKILGHNWNDKKINSIIENSSMCFGAYNKNGEQVGFARIITDYETTCFVMNVVVDNNYRGKGIGTIIMRNILENEKLQNCKFSLIPSTKKVANWYKLLGFKSTNWNYMMASAICKK